MSVETRRRASAGMLAMTMLVGCYLAPRFWVQSHPTLDTTTPAISLTGSGTALSQGATAAGTGVNPESPEIHLSGSWLAGGRMPEVPELGGSTMVQ
ncbi:MAG TPA: hypothetical protein VKB85_11280, partial [Propionibacteriaceae bacterium]|nr:hypothetical protein [Propionibacteriaceae bacterium]